MTERDIRILAWIIQELYSGGSWRRMAEQHPEINDVMSKLPAPEWDD